MHMPYTAGTDIKKGNIMIINGTGQVTAVPDIAILRLGVQTTGDDLTIAQNENARKSQAVLQALGQLGITDIKTFQYAIDKIYDYENGNRIDKGYSVRNILEIRTRNMEEVGIVIDTAVSNGANVVEFINFEVEDTNYYYIQALNLAIVNAYDKAKSITDNLGFKLNPIPIRINENSTPPVPFRMSGMRESFAVTPIEAGNIQIDASVTVEFLYE